MGIFTRRAGTRRSSRILLQKLKAFGLLALLLVAVGFAGWGLWKSGSLARAGGALVEVALRASAGLGFRVEEVLVTGRMHVPQEEVAERLGIRRGMPVFAVDLKAARARLAEAAWVRKAVLSRRLPGVIAVDITERAPAALWQRDKRISVIDAEGAVLTDEIEPYGALPLVAGRGAETEAGALLELLRAEPSIGSQVVSAARVGGRRWDLRLKDGVTVMLPEKDPELALARLARSKELLAKNVARVDLRLPARLVVEPGAPRAAKKES